MNNPVFTGTMTGPRYAATGSTPSVAALAGLGTGGTAAITGNDTRGMVTLVTGTPNSSGSIAQVTFATPYASTPVVMITGGDNIAAQSPYIDQPTLATTSFTIGQNTVITSGITLHFYYWVIE